MKFKGTVIIADPCYFVKGSDWERSQYGAYLPNIGGGRKQFFDMRTHLFTRVQDDWGYLAFDESGKQIGRFAAETANIGVYLLSEIMAYNPEFIEWARSRPDLVLEIPDFDGDITIQKKPFRIVGTGFYAVEES